jgi:hypothetical protein
MPLALTRPATPHGPDLTLTDWAARLVCSACGSRNVDFVVSGSGNRTGIG